MSLSLSPTLTQSVPVSVLGANPIASTVSAHTSASVRRFALWLRVSLPRLTSWRIQTLWLAHPITVGLSADGNTARQLCTSIPFPFPSPNMS